MSDAERQQQTDSELASAFPAPQPQVKHRLSLVWLVPLAAAVAGGYVAFHAISQQGPEIVIVFDHAEGIEAGKTKVKHKNVDVGEVTSVRLNRALDKVLVKVRMAPETEPYLNSETRFWVVRARISAGKIAALGTLVSGAYIGVDPVRRGEPRLRFEGLDKPPAVTTGQLGRRFRLSAETLGSVDIGTPIYYRRIEVGEVIDYQLGAEGEGLMIQVFVNAPYDRLVHTNTRFWHASGIDVSLDGGGVQVNTVSLAALIIGGIAFATPEYLGAGEPAPENATFKLYPNNRAIQEPLYEQRLAYLLRFDGSVRGLSRNAPVEFRGIRIGRVVDVWLSYDEAAGEFGTPILIELEPGRFKKIASERQGRRLIERLVGQGLRAQLKQSSLLTGQLYVELEFEARDKAARVERDGKFFVLPTVPSSSEQMTRSLLRFVQRLGRVDVEAIGAQLEAASHGARRVLDNPQLFRAVGQLAGTLEQTRELIARLQTTVAPRVSSTMVRLDGIVSSLQSLVDEDAPLRTETRSIVLELARTLRSLRSLSDYLQRHPEALLRGKDAAGGDK